MIPSSRRTFGPYCHIIKFQSKFWALWKYYQVPEEWVIPTYYQVPEELQQEGE